MSEPFWSALGAPGGAGSVDYEGAWAAGTQYAPGDVVRHNGVDYLAVNPSTGVDPGVSLGIAAAGIGTSLPASPADGQEYVLVDSLTAPTYSWRFRYVAGITDAYKWVFIGGASWQGFEATLVSWANAAFSTNIGPLFTPPRAGIYDLWHTSVVATGAAQNFYWKWRDATAVIAGAVEHHQTTQSGNQYWVVTYKDRVTVVAAGVIIGMGFRNDAAANSWKDRHHEVLPVRVA